MFLTAGIVILLDQITKMVIQHCIPFNSAQEILPGVFSLVHWGNTGAAWSLFHGQNILLGCIGFIAIFALYYFRKYFEFGRVGGQIAMGLMMGGILGNVCDRFFRGHVIDFLYFYIITREGKELGYPAFNVADIGICVGVGIIILLGFLRVKNESKEN